MIDIHKVISKSEDTANVFDAIRHLIEKEQSLLEAIMIMTSIVDFPEPDFMELHLERIKKFLKNYSNDKD